MTKQADLISVIMPCFNAGNFVEEAVHSALSQNGVAVELIVVDDGSTDGSREILDQLGVNNIGRMKVLHQQNRGPYPARNLALEHAHGEYIAFLDADDYWDPNCLTKLKMALTSAEADIAYCGWQNVGVGREENLPYVPPMYEAEDTALHFLKSCPWPIHAALVKRRIIDAVKGFSERYRTSMDYDIWLRIFAHTNKMVRVPEVLAYYRWHGGGQISSVRWEQVLDAWKVRRDFIANHSDLMQHISRADSRDKVDGFLLKAAYTAFWKRDLVSAQRLFRQVMRTGYWKLRDLKYILPSLLPGKLYKFLVRLSD